MLMLLDMLIFSSGSTDHKTYGYRVTDQVNFFGLSRKKTYLCNFAFHLWLKNKTTKIYI